MMLDHARTEGADQKEGEWLQDAWGERAAPFRATSIRIVNRTKLGWSPISSKTVPPGKPQLTGTAGTIARKLQADPAQRATDDTERTNQRSHAGRFLLDSWPPRRLEEVTAHYAG